MAITIKEITNEKEWQEFEDSYSPHTFLQTWEWGSAQELLGCKIKRLGIFEGAKLRGTAFVYIIKARRGSFLFCPHGPSIDWKTAKGLEELLSALKKIAREQGASFIRLSTLAPNTGEMKKIFVEKGFRNAPIHMMHPENAWILDIAGEEEKILSGMKKRTRYSIRKAEKDGVKIVTSSNPKDVSLFYGMYLETAKRQKFVPFSEKYIMREFEIFEKSQKALMFFAYHQEKLISAAVIIFAGRIAFYHHGASIRIENSGVTASERLQWEAIREAKRRGCVCYNFWGIAPEDNPKHPWQGLTLFKKGFGGYAENYLHAQDLVINQKYWLNYIIEKLRTIKRGY